MYVIQEIFSWKFSFVKTIYLAPQAFSSYIFFSEYEKHSRCALCGSEVLYFTDLLILLALYEICRFIYITGKGTVTYELLLRNHRIKFFI
jgi:hypothetical protein